MKPKSFHTFLQIKPKSFHMITAVVNLSMSLNCCYMRHYIKKLLDEYWATANLIKYFSINRFIKSMRSSRKATLRENKIDCIFLEIISLSPPSFLHPTGNTSTKYLYSHKTILMKCKFNCCHVTCGGATRRSSWERSDVLPEFLCYHIINKGVTWWKFENVSIMH